MDKLIELWGKPLRLLIQSSIKTSNTRFFIDLKHFWEFISGDYEANWLSRSIYSFNTPFLCLLLLFKTLIMIIIPVIFLHLFVFYLVRLFQSRPTHTKIVPEDSSISKKPTKRKFQNIERRLFALTFLILILLVNFGWICIFTNSTLYQAVVEKSNSQNFVYQYELSIFRLQNTLQKHVNNINSDRVRIYDQIYKSLKLFAKNQFLQIHYSILNQTKLIDIISHASSLAEDLTKVKLAYNEMHSKASTQSLTNTLDAIQTFFNEHFTRLEEDAGKLEYICLVGHPLRKSITEIRAILKVLKRALHLEGVKSENFLKISRTYEPFIMPQLELLNLTMNEHQAADYLTDKLQKYIFDQFIQNHKDGRYGPMRSLDGMKFMWDAYSVFLIKLNEVAIRLMNPVSLSYWGSWILKIQIWLLYVPLSLLGIGKLVFLCLPLGRDFPNRSNPIIRRHSNRNYVDNMVDQLKRLSNGSDTLYDAELEEPSDLIVVENFINDIDLDPPMMTFQKNSREKNFDQISTSHSTKNYRERKFILITIINVIFILILMIDVVVFIGFLATVYLESKVCKPSASFDFAKEYDTTVTESLGYIWNEYFQQMDQIDDEYLIKYSSLPLFYLLQPEKIIQNTFYSDQVNSTGLFYHYGVRIRLNQTGLSLEEPIKGLSNYRMKLGIFRNLEYTLITGFKNVKFFSLLDSFLQLWKNPKNGFIKTWNELVENSRISLKNLDTVEKTLIDLKNNVLKLKTQIQLLKNRFVHIESTDSCGDRAKEFLAVLDYTFEITVHREDGSKILVYNFAENKVLRNAINSFREALNTILLTDSNGDVEARHTSLIKSIDGIGYIENDNKSYEKIISIYVNKFEKIWNNLVGTSQLSSRLKLYVENEFDAVLDSLLNPISDMRDRIKDLSALVCSSNQESKDLLDYISSSSFSTQILVFSLQIYFGFIFVMFNLLIR